VRPGYYAGPVKTGVVSLDRPERRPANCVVLPKDGRRIPIERGVDPMKAAMGKRKISIA